MSENTERELIELIISLRNKKKETARLVTDINLKLEETETQLMDLMTANGAVSTAKYSGLGHATIEKPELHASCNLENMDLLIEFLKSNDRLDLVSNRVLPSKLSTYIRERVEKGESIPEFVNYYFKNNLLIYPK